MGVQPWLMGNMPSAMGDLGDLGDLPWAVGDAWGVNDDQREGEEPTVKRRRPRRLRVVLHPCGRSLDRRRRHTGSGEQGIQEIDRERDVRHAGRRQRR